MHKFNLLVGGLLGCAMASTAVFAADPPATAAPAAAPATAAAALDPEQKMICKRVKETGSLIKSTKTCHTKQQWTYINDVNSKFANDYVENSRTRSSGN